MNQLNSEEIAKCKALIVSIAKEFEQEWFNYRQGLRPDMPETVIYALCMAVDCLRDLEESGQYE